MKKVTALLFSFLLVGLTATAASTVEDDAIRGYGNSFIFTEGSVEFSVFPDGQFDFVFIGNQGVNVIANAPGVTASFNGGQDYEAFVQYDDYGAIVQVEEIPIFYDEFGRITQAGNVDIRYRNRRIVNVGGLFVHYNNFGVFSHHTGFINAFNPFYVYRPWHSFYSFPLFNRCVVYDFPYRRFYTPIRYSFFQHRGFYNNRHRVAYHNGRRDFHRPGSRIHYRDGRVARNRDYNPRRTNTAVGNNYRRANNDVASSRRGDRNTSRLSDNRRATTKGRPAVNSRPNVATSKGRPAVNSRPAQSRPKARPNTSSKGRPSVATSKNRPTVKSRPAQRKTQARSTRPSRSVAKAPSSRKSNRSVSRPSSSRKTVARSSGSRAKTSAPNRSSRSKSSSTRSRRGL